MRISKRLLLVGIAWLAVALSFAANAAAPSQPTHGSMQVIGSYQNDTSLPLYYLPAWLATDADEHHEGPENPMLPNHHVDRPDPVIQGGYGPGLPSPRMPAPLMNFDGVGFPGVVCNCAPPDTNGQVGTTQYVQIVNEGFQVFDKTTGDSLLGPQAISALWAGFGGLCETAGDGDPVMLFDQIADRWVISQFAGSSIPTDECVAVSTTDDATGTWNRYAFHLGSNFFDYPKLAVWPDGYYMSMNIFNSSGTAFLGPQAFVFDRTAMLAGNPATVITPGILSGGDFFMPTNLDGATLPPAGAPDPFVQYPSSGAYNIYQFHADFATPANSTFTLFDSPPAAGFTTLCAGNRACVPQLGGTGGNSVDALGDRFMFRLAYRNFGDHDSLVGNYTVKANNVAGVRWFEFRNIFNAPVTVYQESTYQPDSDWRWMGSVAMDSSGNLAVGFSASSPTINPQLRYAGRLSTDPLNALSQGEEHLFDGTGSQQGTGNRWGDYSSLTVDPVDDCTFWYTNEYYASNGQYNWRTRIGSFKFDACGSPNFALQSADLSQDVCALNPTPTALGPVAIQVNALNGFTDPVAMSFGAGLPAGFSGDYTVTPVNPPGSTEADLSVDNTATPGPNLITLRGSSDGIDHDLTLSANVATVTAAAPALVSPPDAANSVAAQPTFTWQASPQAATYLIEIATDSAFNNIVASQTVATTSFQPTTPLATDTQFFWRVTATNVCGGGVSQVFSFTTQPGPGQCSTGTPTQTLFSDDVEGGPNGWTHGAASGSTDTWTIGSDAHGGSSAWQATAPPSGQGNDQWLISPSVTLPTALSGLNLQFWNQQSLKTGGGGCYDGAILEVSTDSGSTWTQLPDTALLTAPYDGTISGSFGNPLGGDSGWCGDPQAYLNSIVDLQNYAGMTVQFRFNLGHDRFAHRSGPNWAIDDIKVQGCGDNQPDDTIFTDGFDGTTP